MNVIAVSKKIAGLFVLAALLVGCGDSGPELAEVEGTLTVDGNPVPNAVVTYVPQFPNASTSSAVTDETGHYVLEYTRDKPGAMIGKHNVQIQVEPVEGGKAVVIPKKYKAEGALTADVQPGENTIDFALESK